MKIQFSYLSLKMRFIYKNNKFFSIFAHLRTVTKLFRDFLIEFDNSHGGKWDTSSFYCYFRVIKDFQMDVYVGSVFTCSL